MFLVPVILCGGSGTRLWPMSREHFPKQLLRLTDRDSSMLQATALRVQGIAKDGEGSDSTMRLGGALVVSNESHRFLVAQQLQEAGAKVERILLEPAGRNTAPAICLAAEEACSRHGDALLLVMPADHLIRDEAAFHATVRRGIELAEDGYLVTFGIVPDSPQTGYGYIRKGAPIAESADASEIDAFVEKPDEKTAESYLASGRYVWNSGMFLFKASRWLEAIEMLRPDIHGAAQEAWRKATADLDFLRMDEEAFLRCPSDSIDYAVMEKVTAKEGGSKLKGAVIALEAGWSDVGSWHSLWEVGKQDEEHNVVQGDVHLLDSHDSLVMADHRAVVGIGLEEMVVVETSDAVLVAPRNQAQKVKAIVSRFKEQGRSEGYAHRRVYRPWGSYEGIDQGERYQVKHIVVMPGAQLSLQMHHHRAEHWVVVRGTAEVTRGEETFLLSENQSTYIPLGTKHRLANPGKYPLELIEVQSGSYLGEDDIVRFEDLYGRDSES